MPAWKTYDLFISHAWKYDAHYHGVVRFLDNANNFYYRNYSAPEHKPVIPPDTRASDKRVREALYNKIRPVNCVVVIAAIYVSHRDWIQAELDLAAELGKPIIGVAPLGQINLPEPVRRVAHEVVHWRQDKIVDAIRRRSI